MPKKIKPAPMTKTMREAKLFTELCVKHGYMFADTLPSKDRSTAIMSTVVTNGKTKRSVSGAVCVKLMVPNESALGQEILKLREAKKARRGR